MSTQFRLTPEAYAQIFGDQEQEAEKAKLQEQIAKQDIERAKLELQRETQRARIEIAREKLELAKLKEQRAREEKQRQASNEKAGTFWVILSAVIPLAVTMYILFLLSNV